jgi:hypothetical protein
MYNLKLKYLVKNIRIGIILLCQIFNLYESWLKDSTIARVGQYQRYNVYCILYHETFYVSIMYLSFPKDTRYYYCKNLY